MFKYFISTKWIYIFKYKVQILQLFLLLFGEEISHMSKRSALDQYAVHPCFLETCWKKVRKICIIINDVFRQSSINNDLYFSAVSTCHYHKSSAQIYIWIKKSYPVLLHGIYEQGYGQHLYYFSTYGLFKFTPVKHTVLATAWASLWGNISFCGTWRIRNGLLAKILWTIFSFLVNFLLGCKRPSGSRWQHVCLYVYVWWTGWAREKYLATTPVHRSFVFDLF